jgi:prepilin-type N-terminal cleavage/methylation domain-containing protein
VRGEKCEVRRRTANPELLTVHRQPPSSGFTLIEVTIATSLLVVIALGSAQLFAVAIRHNVSARQQLVMSLAAARKADELCAASAAGPLAPSPPGALARGEEGFADVIVADGVVCVRRWLVSPLPGYEGRANAVAVRASIAGAGETQIVTICEAAAP